MSRAINSGKAWRGTNGPSMVRPEIVDLPCSVMAVRHSNTQE
jgi:hypothetical protein